MPDQELHKDYPELMSKYLSGNATDAEVQQLESWVLADAEHRRQFVAFKKAWMLSGMKAVEAGVDVEAQWQETSTKLFAEAKLVSLSGRKRRYRWLGIAAAITLLGALSIWALLQWSGERELYLVAGDRVQIVELPDGSRVTLNRASTLRYTPVPALAENGQTAQRLVTLEGDAYFDVERDANRPFLINSGSLQVAVLGTSFYVDARTELPEIQVIVASGLVAVRASDTDTLRLEAGQKGIFEKSRDSLYQQSNEDINFQSIKTDTLHFDDSTLGEIAFALSRHYGVDIDYTGIGDTGNCSLDGTYPGFTLEDILEIIRETWGIEVIQGDNSVVMRGTGCE